MALESVVTSTRDESGSSENGSGSDWARSDRTLQEIDSEHSKQRQLSTTSVKPSPAARNNSFREQSTTMRTSTSASRIPSRRIPATVESEVKTSCDRTETIRSKSTSSINRYAASSIAIPRKCSMNTLQTNNSDRAATSRTNTRSAVERRLVARRSFRRANVESQNTQTSGNTGSSKCSEDVVGKRKSRLPVNGKADSTVPSKNTRVDLDADRVSACPLRRNTVSNIPSFTRGSSGRCSDKGHRGIARSVSVRRSQNDSSSAQPRRRTQSMKDINKATDAKKMSLERRSAADLRQTPVRPSVNDCQYTPMRPVTAKQPVRKTLSEGQHSSKNLRSNQEPLTDVKKTLDLHESNRQLRSARKTSISKGPQTNGLQTSPVATPRSSVTSSGSAGGRYVASKGSSVKAPLSKTRSNPVHAVKKSSYAVHDGALNFAEDCDFEVHSMFGIKKSRNSVHTCYKIGRIIGDGNFAVVRECRNRRSQKAFALKVISKAKVKGKEHMIENEILILRRIRHKNIVELIEEFETPKEIFLVMELVEGGDLFDAIVANTRFSEHDSAFMIRDLASAVDYLHSLNIVHRDIKPENLLVVNKPDGSKAIKLADFGLSIEVKSLMFLVCGTPTYVAPEILEECGYGLKVDIWAVGVICYILLCGFPPFRSSNHDQEELFDKILRGDYEYLAPFWDDICDDPRDLIDHLLVVDVNRRYDAKDILNHFWIEKWTRPNEKIHRELSEEVNLHNRKRLRGVALAIQSVISLLHTVRARNALAQQLNSDMYGGSVSQLMLDRTHRATSKSTAGFSRIPRPRPTPCSHIADIRKSITAPIKRGIPGQSRNHIGKLNIVKPKPAPDCSLRKGFLKREEAIHRAFMNLRIPVGLESPATPRKTYLKNDGKVSSPVHSKVPLKHVKFRPMSVIEVRKELEEPLKRPSSAQSPRVTMKNRSRSVEANNRPSTAPTEKPSNVTLKKQVSVAPAPSNDVPQTDKPLGACAGITATGVALRKKPAGKCRQRPHSMIETGGRSSPLGTYFRARAEHAHEQKLAADTDRYGRHDRCASDGMRPRPTSLLLKDAHYDYRLHMACPIFDGEPLEDLKESSPTLKVPLANFTSDHALQALVSSSTNPHENSIKNTSYTSEPIPQKQDIERTLSSTKSSASKTVLTKTVRQSNSPTVSPHTSPRKTYGSARKASVSNPPPLRSPIGPPPVRRATSVDPTHPPRWNCSTRPERKHHLSSSSIPAATKKKPPTYKATPRKDNPNSTPKHKPCSDIKITTETKKRKNIKFPSGKTVDKETKTKTVVSLNSHDSSDKPATLGGALLKRVKKLAQEIESFSKPDRDAPTTSDSSSDSLLGAHISPSSAWSAGGSSLGESLVEEDEPDTTIAGLMPSHPVPSHTDVYSGTEYLSLSDKNKFS